MCETTHNFAEGVRVAVLVEIRSTVEYFNIVGSNCGNNQLNRSKHATDDRERHERLDLKRTHIVSTTAIKLRRQLH